MKLKVFFLSLLATFAGASCGVGLEDSDGPNQDRIEKNEKLRAEYSALKGAYDGTLRLASDPKKDVPATLFLFDSEVQGEPEPGTLKPSIRVVLRGRLMLKDRVGDSDNMIVTGSYDSETGKLSLLPDAEISKTPEGCRLGGTDSIGVVGSADRNSVNTEIQKNGVPWARFVSSSKSQDVGNGATLSVQEEYDRIEKIYRPLLGTYEGTLKRNLPGCEKETVRIEEGFRTLIYMARVTETQNNGPTTVSCVRPRIVVRTMRSLSGDLSDVTYLNIGGFDPNAFLPEFKSGNDLLKFQTIEWLNSETPQLVGNIRTTGDWGEIKIHRIAKEVQAPEDEYQLLKDRRARTFKKYVGIYSGMVDSPTKDWCAEVNVYMTETTDSEGFSMLNMRGIYTNLEVSDPTIGRRLMDIQLNADGCIPKLVMKSNPTGNSNIPGVGLMRFDAQFTSQNEVRQLTGGLEDHRGPLGTMTLLSPGDKRCVKKE